jgi:hypothetical protein
VGKDLKSELQEVMGGGGQLAPGGTAAVLTRPSGLDLELATRIVRQIPLDSINRDLGAIAAREVADELQRHGLKAADIASLPDLPQLVARRLVARLVRSDEFARSFTQHLLMRS